MLLTLVTDLSQEILSTTKKIIDKAYNFIK
jgi:hypothetical protein